MTRPGETSQPAATATHGGPPLGRTSRRGGKRWRRAVALGVAAAALGPAAGGSGVAGRVARAATGPTTAADVAKAEAPNAGAKADPQADAKAKAEAAVRARWERAVQLYGQEATGQFSLRVLDRDATFEGQFVFKELWKFDAAKKQWVRVADQRQEAKVVPAAKKPAEAPLDSQLLADLPIQLQDVGLYYAKWTGDGVPCATYARLGPRARQRTLKGKPPPGYKVEDVPIDVNHAEPMIIPSPQYFTGEGSEPVPAGKK